MAILVCLCVCAGCVYASARLRVHEGTMRVWARVQLWSGLGGAALEAC
jgi:hypothetical protein